MGAIMPNPYFEEEYSKHDYSLDGGVVSVRLEMRYKFEGDFLEDYLQWLDGARDDEETRMNYAQSLFIGPSFLLPSMTNKALDIDPDSQLVVRYKTGG